MPHDDTTRRSDEAGPGRPGTSQAAKRGLGLLAVIIAWLAVGGAGGPLVGRLAEVQENDNANFLPATAESTLVSDLTGEFTGEQPLPYLLVFEREGGVTPDDLGAIQRLVGGLADLELSVDDSAVVDETLVQDSYPLADYLVAEAAQILPSQDGEAVLVVVRVDSEAATANLPDGQTVVFQVAETMRTAIAGNVDGDGITGYVTGLGGFFADFVIAFEGIDGTLLQVTLLVVFLILLLVYRSPILPFAALLSAIFALGAAALVIYPLADNGVIGLNGQSQGILFILVVGATTDYALLLVSRYREELHAHRSKYAAMKRAWRAAAPPIVASAATVILGLLCLLLSELGSNRGLGPVGAIGVAFALVVALTLLPALLLVPSVIVGGVAAAAGAGLGAVVAGTAGATGGAVTALAAFGAVAYLRWRAIQGTDDGPRLWYARPESGRWLFWPRVPDLDDKQAAEALGQRGIWGRVSAFVGARPRTIWVVCLVALLGLAGFVPAFAADGIKNVDFFRDRVQSVVGQEVLERHFPAGSGTPAQIVVGVADVEAAASVIGGVDGIVGVAPYAALDGLPDPAAPPPQPVVVDGKVLLQATLEPAADSAEAEDLVERLRVELDTVSSDALVGGLTATNLDVRDASQRDLQVIIPAILLVILVVLCLLLRSLVAPVIIIAANVLSFAATIGTSALVFNYVLDLPGGDPAIPLYGFVFLVALGVDYSIFLMTRVREESVHRGTRPGILVGLAVTGGVITSAGVVLAATFSALATLPILFLLQIAFIVAFGVLLDTTVVRSLLVPALSYDIGPRIWWPSSLARVSIAAPGKHASAALVADQGEEVDADGLNEPGPGTRRRSP